MHLFRRPPPDRRAARLVAMTSRASGTSESVDPTGMAALERALAAYGTERLGGRGDAREADEALRAAAGRLAAEARARDPVRAERLLVALKPAWRALPAVQHAADTDARSDLWDRLVRLCVEEFYAPARASGARAPAAPPAAGS